MTTSHTHGATLGRDAPERHPPKSRLLLQIGSAFVAATAVTVLFVLPAEYGLDPTGFGDLTGLTRLAEPVEVVVETRSEAPIEIHNPSALPFRSDTVSIRVGGLDENFGQLEYKVTMQAGSTLVYSWAASDALIYEFHGHTLATEENPEIQVMNYQAGDAAEAHGSFTAPIDGIHGWYFANRNISEPVEIELKLSGYYRLEPGVMDLGR